MTGIDSSHDGSGELRERGVFAVARPRIVTRSSRSADRDAGDATRAIFVVA